MFGVFCRRWGVPPDRRRHGTAAPADRHRPGPGHDPHRPPSPAPRPTGWASPTTWSRPGAGPAPRPRPSRRPSPASPGLPAQRPRLGPGPGGAGRGYGAARRIHARSGRAGGQRRGRRPVRLGRRTARVVRGLVNRSSSGGSALSRCSPVPPRRRGRRGVVPAGGEGSGCGRAARCRAAPGGGGGAPWWTYRVGRGRVISVRRT